MVGVLGEWRVWAGGRGGGGEEARGERVAECPYDRAVAATDTATDTAIDKPQGSKC